MQNMPVLESWELPMPNPRARRIDRQLAFAFNSGECVFPQALSTDRLGESYDESEQVHLFQ